MIQTFSEIRHKIIIDQALNHLRKKHRETLARRASEGSCLQFKEIPRLRVGLTNSIVVLIGRVNVMKSSLLHRSIDSTTQ